MKRLAIGILMSLLILAACTPPLDPAATNLPVVDEGKSPATTTATVTTPTISPTIHLTATPTATASETPEPSNQWIAYIDLSNNVMLIDPFSKETRALTSDAVPTLTGDMKTGVQYGSPAWSSDGQLLAVKKAVITQFSDHQEYAFGLTVFDLLTGSQHDLLPDSQLSDFAWQPDTRQIAYTMLADPGYFTSRAEVDSSLAKGIMVIDVESEAVTELVKPQKYSLIGIHFSPDGRFIGFNEIIYMEGRGNFAYSDLETNEYFRWEQQIGNYNWSQDGELIYYDTLTYVPSGDEQIFSNDRYEEDEQLIAEGEDNSYVSDPKLSPDGEMLLFKETKLAIDSPSTKINVKELSNGDTETLFEGDDIFNIVWAPDGEFVLAVLGPYDNPTLLMINAYDGNTESIGSGWSPAWQPMPID